MCSGGRPRPHILGPGPVDGDAYLATCFVRARAELFDPLGKPLFGLRKPLVPVGEDAVDRPRPVAADQDRRMGLLDGFRPAPDWPEADVGTFVAGLVLGPDLLHRKYAVLHQPEAALGVRAVVAHLLDVPAGPDAEEEAAAGEEVEVAIAFAVAIGSRSTIRQMPVPTRSVSVASAALHQRDEGVKRVLVLAGQLAPAGSRGFATRGDVGVLGEEQGLEAAILGVASELSGVDPLVGGEDRDAVLHDPPPIRPVRR